MSTPTISRKTLSDAVLTRLRTVTDATIFLGEAVDVPLQDDKVHVTPYACFYPGGGTPGPEDDLADVGVDLEWLIQVNVAGGSNNAALALADRIHGLLYRWAPAVDGLVCGPFRPPAGYQPPLLLDRDVTPHRPYLPLQYVTTITAT